MANTRQYPYTWEEAIEILREDPNHQQLIRDAYLTADRLENCHRFLDSGEFKEVLAIIQAHAPQARRVVDIPGGNGIASFAFAKSGFEVAAVEPDPSNSVGRGAIDFVIQQEKLTNVKLVDAYGEKLPFADSEFDVAYVRQGLHHARDLAGFVSEITRVLRLNGLLIASREPVVDDYDKSLEEFLDAQPDHQLYGGENALTHKDYLRHLNRSELTLIGDFGPHESIINLHPKSFAELKAQMLNSRSGRILNAMLPAELVYRYELWIAKYRHREQGRLHTFIARKTR
jgi:ubiquinone/menaquinone biosynthesis C-methylase UbiE